MREFIANDTEQSEVKKTYKLVVFSMGNRNEKIRDLVLKMSRIPIKKEKEDVSE